MMIKKKDAFFAGICVLVFLAGSLMSFFRWGAPAMIFFMGLSGGVFCIVCLEGYRRIQKLIRSGNELQRQTQTEQERQLVKLCRQLDLVLWNHSETEGFPEMGRASVKILEASPSTMATGLKRAQLLRPPSIIPGELLGSYTMNGQIPVQEWYRDDTYPLDSPLVYEKKRIDQYIKKIEKRQPNYYGETGKWLQLALEKYSIRNQNVIIMGSVDPWCESFCLYYGARCTTVEYNKIVSQDVRLNMVSPKEYDRSPVKFDAALSISSFEHDGLGRYGDPLNPYGDLDAMRELKSKLQTGGKLFLSVPLGRDALVWNVHRIYGRLRLPMLLENWEILDTFGYEESRLDNGEIGQYYQPVFVLANIA